MKLLRWVSVRYDQILKGYRYVLFGGLLLHLLLPVWSFRDRLAMVGAAAIGVLWMFWGAYLVVGAQIQLHGHSPFVVSAVLFFFYFFAFGTLLGLSQVFVGSEIWPFSVFVPAATSLGVVRAYAKIPNRRAPIAPSESN